MKEKFDGWLRVSNVLIIAAFIPWSVWVTKQTILNEEFRNVGPRITQKDLLALEVKITLERDAKIQSILDGVLKQYQVLHDDLLKISFLIAQHIGKEVKAQE